MWIIINIIEHKEEKEVLLTNLEFHVVCNHSFSQSFCSDHIDFFSFAFFRELDISNLRHDVFREKCVKTDL